MNMFLAEIYARRHIPASASLRNAQVNLSERLLRCVLRQLLENPTTTITDIQWTVKTSDHYSIGNSTVYRQIRDVGLIFHRPSRRLPFTALHRRQRLEWCYA
ncbi:hypothetical protein TNCT_386671 [Trichonephila clavata]|uniref:Transposase Tc1-like domain-containing protein n=1 Tax=Trichonephila clavata TaxID=2740835 RepID=A0A8X6LRN8_TRICU|nr:hypothetical protein TNCT_386671 [Trichonephila clavata]